MTNFIEVMIEGLKKNRELFTNNEDMIKEIESDESLIVEVDNSEDGFILTLIDYKIEETLLAYNLDGVYSVEYIVTWESGKVEDQELFSYKTEKTARKKAIATGIEWDQTFYKEGQA